MGILSALREKKEVKSFIENELVAMGPGEIPDVK